ncbi:BREX-1 system adenine-specific DNA-methyltransferase PglX [Raoultibacter massiliensis]|uniref:site-specific DNA-methyltransferase (adenine-specific) n=1 Tax=Raoultibacter massiliensis TaxID=1852371 RepID=A0ABV1JEC2_9ACTN
MDSNRIKKLATGVRTSLMAEVSAKLDRVLAEGSPERLDSPSEVRSLEAAIKEQGQEKVIEANAYTWFNRLCALRFMDANGYTPVGIVTPKGNSTQPEILANAMQGVFDSELGFDRLVRDKVAGIISGSIPTINPMEAAYEVILNTVCKHYAKPMPYLFKDEASASELLMPQGLLAENSLLRRIDSEMDAEACESVEVLGWLYQFYIAEKKDEVFASKKKRGAAEIPAATQLFTPNWIVRYMAENSLGRLWMLNNPHSGLKDSMDYYIEGEAATDYLKIYSPEEISVLDPACGSGHILVYAFDLLYKMYEEEGYLPDDIPALILQKNLFGFEIDQRAAEIAKFALEMKAREKDAKFFERCIDANITVLEPIRFSGGELEEAGMLREQTALLEAYDHLDEIGSLYVPGLSDDIFIDNAIANIKSQNGMFAEAIVSALDKMKELNDKLSQKFSVVIANPPYMSPSAMEQWTKKWVEQNYPDEKSDLCTCFIKRGFDFTVDDGYDAMVTMQSWMFLSSFEKMRGWLIENKSLITMAHLGSRAFDAIGGEVVSVTAAVFENDKSGTEGSYIRLVDLDGSEQKRMALVEAIQDSDSGWFYQADAEDFKKIPGSPISYWVSKSLYDAFESDALGSILKTREGMATANNDRFTRRWPEVSYSRITFACPSYDSDTAKAGKWFPYNKGGDFRKWYGNNDLVVNWENDGYEIRNNVDEETGRIRSHNYNGEFAFREGITWSAISSSDIHVRHAPTGFLFDSKGAKGFAESSHDLIHSMALINSSIGKEALKVLAPTLDFKVGDIIRIPFIDSDSFEIVSIGSDSIEISRRDWDAFETSWDFEKHPLLPQSGQNNILIDDVYSCWDIECQERFDALKANEEELNRIFAKIYNMEGEVPIEVPDDKVSVRLADKSRDVKSLISYGVGCILGRYSTDKPGLILANQGSTVSDFNAKIPNATFPIDKDGILPILEGEWFEDDIVEEFKRWLSSTYGSETLQANIAFIEDALGEDLRSYFVKHFYDDHVKTYQKRPIYWLFSSPKKSFNALVYLHRYDEGTVGDILTGYLRDYITKLNGAIASLETSERAVDQKQADKYRNIVKELEEWERDVIYPMAHERISIDLDDGVKVNYNKFPHALRKITGLSEWK